MARSSCTPREPLTSTTSPGADSGRAIRRRLRASGKKDGSDSAPAGRGGEMLRVAAHADDEIESRFGGGFAAGSVQRGRVFAEFEHFAGDQDAALGGTRGQRVNHGAQRLGVGVVAVIEDRGAGNLDDFTALVAGRERLERGDGGIEVDSGLESHGEAGHRIGRVVRAEQMERKVRLRARPHDSGHARPAVSSVDVENLRIGTGADAEVDHAALEVAPELRHVRIVAVEKCNAVGGQRGNQFEFCARNTGLALGEVLDVRGANVGDDTPVGSGDAGERGDLAKVVHAHFDDGEFVFGLQGAAAAAADRRRC